MNLIGATVRYPIAGVKKTEQSKVVSTLKTRTGEMALKLANGRVLCDPPFILVRFPA